MAESRRWEDYVWRVKERGKPEEVANLAKDIRTLSERVKDMEGRAGWLREKTTGKEGDVPWKGPAGRAFRGLVVATLEKPLADRSAKLEVFGRAVERAADMLAKAQRDMPVPIVGAGVHTVTPPMGAAHGRLNNAYEYRQTAFDAYKRNGSLSLTSSPAVFPTDVPEGVEDDLLWRYIDQWYIPAQNRALEVYTALDTAYRQLGQELTIPEYVPEAPAKEKEEPYKPGDKDTTGGPKDTTPTNTGPKDTKPETTPETKPETKPETTPETKPEDTEPEDTKPEETPEQENEQT
ncbi:MAG TPA: hypothetical protein VGF17_17975, partial [Phytomonospora sp.]